MISRPLEFRAPETLEEALDALDQLGPEASLLAGGMSLLPLMNLGLRRPAAIVSLARINVLIGIDLAGDGARIGSMTSHRALAEHPALEGPLVALRDAARAIGDHQVRNRGTIGGSVAQAESYADYLPVLLALDATVELTSRAGARRVPVGELLGEPGLASGEIVVAVHLAPPAGARSGHARIARTAGSAPLVTAAALVADSEVRIAVGGASPVPIVVRGDGAGASGEQLVAAIAERLGDGNHPGFADHDYRVAMAPVVAGRAVAAALGDSEVVP